MTLCWSVSRDSGYLAQKVALPSYVTANLFLNLDANSYSGSGVTWSDLSGNGRNATLTNGPTYSGANGGYFHFTDTSFQSAITASVPSLTTWSVECWYRATKSWSANTKVTALVCNEFDLVNKLNYSIGSNNAPSSYNIAGGFYDGSWHTTSGLSPTLNTWYQALVTYNGSIVTQYSNGVSQSTLTYSGTPQSGGAIRIARRWDNASNVATDFYDGDISIVRIYSGALSSAQVLQNFNAIRGRYGI